MLTRRASPDHECRSTWARHVSCTGRSTARENKKYGEILKDLHRKTDSIVIKHQKAIDEQNRLLKTAAMIEDIQKIYFIGGVGATAGGLINLGLKKINEKRAEDQKQVEKMSNVELQKLTEDRQKREQLREKRYGGKKCYTCNSSKLKVLYNKANYKK